MVRSIRNAIGFSSGVPRMRSTSFWKCFGWTSSGPAPEAVPECPDELLELRHFEWIRFFVDAVQRRHFLIGQVLRHSLVGDEHELFDDPMGDVPLECNDLCHHAFVVEDDLRLFQVEVDRAATMAAAVQDLEQLAHVAKERDERLVLRRYFGIAIGQDGVDVRVRHPGVAVDHAVVQLVSHHGALTVDLHEARLNQAIDVSGFRLHKPGREIGREHMDGAVGKIHGRRPLVRLQIERAALLHVMGDVGNMDAEPEVAVRQPIEGDRVIEIAGMLAVDRDGRPRPEIGPTLEIALADLRAEPARLGDRLVAVRVRDAVLPDDDFIVNARLVDRAENLGDASEWTSRWRRPAGDLHDHHVPWFRISALATRRPRRPSPDVCRTARRSRCPQGPHRTCRRSSANRA